MIKLGNEFLTDESQVVFLVSVVEGRNYLAIPYGF
jgi:hypothetical protein